MKDFRILLFLMLLILPSCVKEEPGNGKEEELLEGEIKFETRAGEYPAENTTFGFFVYNTSATVLEPTNKNWTGTYRFNLARGSLMPCTNNSSGVPQAADDYTPTSGLQIASTGNYDFYMHTPGIPAKFNNMGSIRITYNRDIPLRVSTQAARVAITYYKIHKIDFQDIPLQDMIAYYSFSFKQGSASTFTIDPNSVHLYNMGDYCDYHPKLRTNQIFGQGEELSSHDDKVYITKTSNSGQNAIIYEPSASNPVKKIYPLDYTDSGTKALNLEFDLMIGASTTTINVPISLNVVPSKHYKFTIEITSSLITVNYIVTNASWNDYNMGGMDIGGTGTTGTVAAFIIPNWEEGIPDAGQNDDHIG